MKGFHCVANSYRLFLGDSEKLTAAIDTLNRFYDSYPQARIDKTVQNSGMSPGTFKLVQIDSLINQIEILHKDLERVKLALGEFYQ